MEGVDLPVERIGVSVPVISTRLMAGDYWTADESDEHKQTVRLKHGPVASSCICSSLRHSAQSL